MKKVFGIQAEFNFTADEDITKGLGKGLQKGTILLEDVFVAIKPVLVKAIEEHLINKKITSEK